MSTHTIGAFAIIFDDSSRVLLCHRTDQDLWNLPGGGVEAHESPWDAVIREVMEEVGLVVRVERLLGIYAAPMRSSVVLNFLCVPVGGTIRLSDESDAIQWFSLADLPSNTLPRHRDRVSDAINQPTEVILKVSA
jgi:ADP-ribose pyrophosphatase YjhB (NUDIX family)